MLFSLFTLCAVPAAAQAAADIEAVWTFSGGQVAVNANPDGTFTGTVIRTVKLVTCPHAVGEQMWINMRPQLDGSYWGGHQWYNDGCRPAERRGNTAYRVIAHPDGHRFLRVCFSRPSTPDVQPAIAPDGSSTNPIGTCADSELAGPISAGTPPFNTIVSLPKRTCRSRRSFTIRLREPAGDALKTASVYLNGKRVRVRRGKRITAAIRLRGLPKGRYTVKIVARTVLGKTIRGSRTYRTCTKKKQKL